jgi:hypothetical protein
VDASINRLATDTDHLTARGAKCALSVGGEPPVDGKAGDAEEQRHFARIVDVAVEVADVEVDSIAVGNLT